MINCDVFCKNDLEMKMIKKIVCIDTRIAGVSNETHEYITLGKVYEVLDGLNPLNSNKLIGYYQIVNDANSIFAYSKKNFMDLRECRKQKLIKISKA
jgi:Ni,Fe-hydrogenase I cytochrome b subunit